AMDGGGVSISGEANFGVKFKENDGGANTPNELQFHHEFDVKFSASGTTDGGIGFGGSVSIDNTESVTGAGKGAKAAEELTRLQTQTIAAAGELAAITAGTNPTITSVDAFVFLTSPDILVTVEDNKITGIETTAAIVEAGPEGLGVFKLDATTGSGNRAIVVIDGKPVIVTIDGDNDNWVYNPGDTTNGGGDEYIYKIGPGDGPMTTKTAATFDPDASQTVGNHGEVYISMDMHKLTIGSDLDAADKLAGGLTDPGFDGIGIDDEAERVWGGSAADVRYDGDFGVAKVAISYGDKAGDAEWAAGFSFNVEPVTFGAGFDSKGVMSIGMGFTQGQISMNALYSTDSDHDEDDNEAMKVTPAGENKAAVLVERSNAPDLKNQAIGVDMTYKMSDATSLVLVAAQHKKESAAAYYKYGESDLVAKTNDETTGYEQEWTKSSTTVDAFGVGFSHDLGGGATLKAGAGSVDSNAVADLGITMKF
ncbi:MAG: hypothetical protein OXC53_07290, partial [Rhodobacteraceae bacterium]|nr:hypothetical protein [Paracoccaceae bacterium]